ncbi:MAG: hypothetical protein ACRDRO_17580 [Pseudonocardiaceae bacterium]
MTNDLPRPVEPSGAPDRPSARTRPRPVDRVDPAATDGADPAKKAAPAKKTTPAKKAGQSMALVLRSARPPLDQLDFDDRHDTRATESEEMAQRYAGLRKDRRRNDWHYLAMGLVVFVVGVAVYLAGFVLVSRLLPYLDPRLVTQIVGLACIAGGGGAAVRSAGRALKQRYDRRRGQASDST